MVIMVAIMVVAEMIPSFSSSSSCSLSSSSHQTRRYYQWNVEPSGGILLLVVILILITMLIEWHARCYYHDEIESSVEILFWLLSVPK